MNAYNISYLNDAQCIMGEMIHFAIHDMHDDPDSFWQSFCGSEVASGLSNGDPKYLAGMSGVEVYYAFYHETYGSYIDKKASFSFERSPEYWAGWSLAYYQWLRCISYEKMSFLGITLTSVISDYILHEADLDVFVDVIDNKYMTKDNAAMLKRLRAYMGITQKTLSDRSGVALRMIQLYEQGQNEISKASASTLMDISRTLCCDSDLLIFDKLDK